MPPNTKRCIKACRLTQQFLLHASLKALFGGASMFHVEIFLLRPYLLAEDLADFDLLNSPFKMRHAVRLSPHAKNITPKGFTL